MPLDQKALDINSKVLKKLLGVTQNEFYFKIVYKIEREIPITNTMVLKNKTSLCNKLYLLSRNDKKLSIL